MRSSKFDLDYRSGIKHSTVTIQPKILSQPYFEIIRIPWEGSLMKVMPVALCHKFSPGVTDARTKHLELWLMHVPDYWS